MRDAFATISTARLVTRSIADVTLLSTFVRKRRNLMPLIVLPDLRLYGGGQTGTYALTWACLVTILLPQHVTNSGRRVKLLICTIIWAMYTAKLLFKEKKKKKKNPNEKKDTNKGSKEEPDEGHRRLNRHHWRSDRYNQGLKRDLIRNN